MNSLKGKIHPQDIHKKTQGNPSAISIATTFSGPIPPPSFLEQYELLVPGIAKRFLEEPRIEAEHRRAFEKLIVQEQIK